MKRIPSLISELKNTETLNRIALLGAFSMFLATLEYLFPKPLPFMRLGLANLPLILGLEILSGPAYALLVIMKVLGQALVNGTLASYVFLFSLGGSLASALVMRICYKGLGSQISFIGISLMGALASNTVQISLSIQFIFGDAAWRILPLFLAVGLVSGLFIGIFAEFFSASSRWWKGFSRGIPVDSIPPADSRLPKFLTRKSGGTKKAKPRKVRKKRKDLLGSVLSPVLRFWTGLCLIPAWLFLDSLLLRILLLPVFIILATVSGKKIRALYFLILTASITFFHLLTPLGRVMWSFGPFTVTVGALEAGLTKAVTLCGLIMISLFSVSGRLRLPGMFGGLLARTFYFFEEILEGKGRIHAGRFIASLDEVLIGMFSPDSIDKLAVAEPEAAESRGKTAAGIVYIVLTAGLLWGSLILQFSV